MTDKSPAKSPVKKKLEFETENRGKTEVKQPNNPQNKFLTNLNQLLKYAVNEVEVDSIKDVDDFKGRVKELQQSLEIIEKEVNKKDPGADLYQRGDENRSTSSLVVSFSENTEYKITQREERNLLRLFSLYAARKSKTVGSPGILLTSEFKGFLKDFGIRIPESAYQEVLCRVTQFEQKSITYDVFKEMLADIFRLMNRNG